MDLYHLRLHGMVLNVTVTFYAMVRRENMAVSVLVVLSAACRHCVAIKIRVHYVQNCIHFFAAVD